MLTVTGTAGVCRVVRFPTELMAAVVLCRRDGFMAESMKRFFNKLKLVSPVLARLWGL